MPDTLPVVQPSLGDPTASSCRAAQWPLPLQHRYRHELLCRDESVRQLVAFIGGLDLCDGRYDTSEHSLFHTIKTVHSDDYHQACCPNGNIKQGGVCRITGVEGVERLRLVQLALAGLCRRCMKASAARRSVCLDRDRYSMWVVARQVLRSAAL